MPDQNLKKKNGMELEFMELEFHLNCMELIKTKNCIKTPLQGFKTSLQGSLNLIWGDQTYKNKKLHENAIIGL